MATSVAGNFAAGDVGIAGTRCSASGSARSTGHLCSTKGPAAARNMLGISTVYEQVPLFFSDQYDVAMEYALSALAVPKRR